MKYLKAYITEHIRSLVMVLCIAAIMTVTLFLNGIPLREIEYGLLLCAFIMAVFVITGYVKHWENLQQLEQMRKNITEAPNEMKQPEYLYEKLYQDCITAIAQKKALLQNEMLSRQQDMSEYYSMWVHQIKTPIAALRLLIEEEINACLDADHIDENDIHFKNETQKQQELFRIEQYVDMALQYVRLGAKTNDFVIQTVILDDVIKPSVHKYARQFIHKKLSLTYVPQNITATTDKKWLGFVIDQLLSNAVKYTQKGGITISAYSRENVHIIIEDTGIGISSEDLPRIFEKGYTGYNGHADKYSTGIGLYLCREITNKLGHKLIITSDTRTGTRAEIIITNANLTSL